MLRKHGNKFAEQVVLTNGTNLITLIKSPFVSLEFWIN